MPEQVADVRASAQPYACSQCRSRYRYRDQAADCERHHDYAARCEATICQRAAAGESHEVLAKSFGMTVSHVARIVGGQPRRKRDS